MLKFCINESTHERTYWFFTNSFVFSFPIAYMTNETLKLRYLMTYQSSNKPIHPFQGVHQKDLCFHSSMYSLLPVQVPLSWEFVIGNRLYKYYCLHPNHTNHTMLWCFLVLSDLSTIFLLIYYLCKMLLYHLMSLHHSLWSVLLSDQQ